MRFCWWTLVALLSCVASTAHAQSEPEVPYKGSVSFEGKDSDEWKRERSEASFERDGFAASLSAGPVIYFGTGELADVRGVGAGLSFRLGTSAGPKLLWFFQFDGTARSDTVAFSSLSVNAHYYFRQALWARGGLGLASFLERASDGNEGRALGTVSLHGGLGVDLFRRGIFAVDFEWQLTRARFGDDGTLLASALQLAVNWY